MSVKNPIGKVFSRKITKTVGQHQNRHRRKGDRVIVLNIGQIGINDKQRARMALSYPHLFTVTAQELLEAVVEERAGQVAVD